MLFMQTCYNGCVIHTIDVSLGLLTYNDKVLLMLRDNRLHISGANKWCFVGGGKEQGESFEQAVLREIKESTGLHLLSVTLLTTITDTVGKNYVYHATLTTDNLNNIKRGEGQDLNFFTLPEVEKLSLATATKIFFSNNKDTLQKILHN